MAVINKEWMQNVYKTPRIKAESLPFNHISIAWFKIHYAGVQRQNCKSCIVISKWALEMISNTNLSNSTICSLFFPSLREQTNKRRIKEIVKEFALLCRGPQGSGYSDY